MGKTFIATLSIFVIFLIVIFYNFVTSRGFKSMKSLNKQLAICGFLLISGMFFVGCGWFKKSDSTSGSLVGATGDVLLTIDGQPVLTVSEYEKQLDMARAANPQVDMILQMMPNAEREFVFRGISTSKLMKAWADKEGITKNTDFKEQQKHLHEAMDLQLYMKAFDEKNPIKITDSDVEQFYHEKRDSIPGLAITQAGVDTSFVRFDSKAKAQAFFDKVKEVKKADEFKKVAENNKEQAGQSVINDKSPFSDALKKTVLDIKKFPSVQIVKVSDNGYWVVLVTGKSEAKYHDLKSPQVQQGLRKMIEDERKGQLIEREIEKLKKDLNVVENSSYFEQKEAKKRAAMQEQGSDDNNDVMKMLAGSNEESDQNSNVLKV
jgi:hypothetical protein